MAVANSVCEEESGELSLGLSNTGHEIRILRLDGLQKDWAGAQSLASEAGIQWRIPSISDVEQIEELDPKAVSYEFWTANEYPTRDDDGMYVKSLGQEKRPNWKGTPTGVLLIRNG